MEVWSGYATGSSDQTDLLAALHGVANRDLRLAHVEVAGDDAIAMIDVDDITREEELGDEGNDAAIRGEDRIAGRAAIVDAEVAARNLAVEDASVAELARHARWPRAKEGKSEKLRRLPGVMADVSRELIFMLDSRVVRGVDAGEFWIDAKSAGSGRSPARSRDGRRVVRILEQRAQRVDALRRSDNHDGCDDGIRGVDRDGSEGLPAPVRGRAEVYGLARHRPSDADNRVGVPGGAVDRQSDKGPNGGLFWLDDQPSLRDGASRANERGDARCEQMMSENAALHRHKLHERRLKSATVRRPLGTKGQ